MDVKNAFETRERTKIKFPVEDFFPSIFLSHLGAKISYRFHFKTFKKAFFLQFFNFCCSLNAQLKLIFHFIIANINSCTARGKFHRFKFIALTMSVKSPTGETFARHVFNKRRKCQTSHFFFSSMIFSWWEKQQREYHRVPEIVSCVKFCAFIFHYRDWASF